MGVPDLNVTRQDTQQENGIYERLHPPPPRGKQSRTCKEISPNMMVFSKDPVMKSMLAPCRATAVF